MVTVIKINITMDIPEWDRIMDIIIIVLEIVAVNTARVVSVDKVVALNKFGLALQAIRRMLIVNSTVSSSIEALNSTKNAPIDC